MDLELETFNLKLPLIHTKRLPFRKTDRLKGRAFDAVFKRGRWSAGPRLKTGVYAACNAGRPRLGVIVSRAFGGAVQRNRFKRLAREVFRLHQDGLARGVDIVVMPRRAAPAPKDFSEMKSELLQLWKKAGLEI